MTTKFNRRLSYLIKQLETAVHVRLDACLKEMRITAPQYTVLCQLRGRDDWSSAALARRHRVTAQTMYELVTSLERRALISRQEKPTNRRILLITLTNKGRRLLEECDERVDMLESEMFGHLPPRAEAHLYNTLVDLIGRFRAPEAKSMPAQAAE